MYNRRAGVLWLMMLWLLVGTLAAAASQRQHQSGSLGGVIDQ